MPQAMDHFDILKTKLQLILPSLPRSEKAAATYLVENLHRIGSLNLNTISAETNSSGATIIRLCKHMGYRGFLDFRNSVRMAEYPLYDGGDAVPVEHASIRELMCAVIDKNNETVRNTLALISDQYEPAAIALREANIITMFGNGDAVIPCQLISMKFMKVGKACVVLNDQDMQMFCASSIRSGDVALAVSHTGRSKSVVEAMRIAHDRGAITIGVTASAKSPLLKYCSYALFTGTVDETDTGDIISRRIAEQTILETLYLRAVDNAGKDLEEVKKQGAKVIAQMTKLSDEDGGAKV